MLLREKSPPREVMGTVHPGVGYYDLCTGAIRLERSDDPQVLECAVVVRTTGALPEIVFYKHPIERRWVQPGLEHRASIRDRQDWVFEDRDGNRYTCKGCIPNGRWFVDRRTGAWQQKQVNVGEHHVSG